MFLEVCTSKEKYSYSYKVFILSWYKCKAKDKKDLEETDIDKAETLANQFSSVMNWTQNGTYLISPYQIIEKNQLYFVKVLS